MNEARVHADAAATLKRLKAKNPELKQELSNSYGFAVFPFVGRASVVLGGAYGHGAVFEQGKPIGFATLSQISIGVQVGGQTFSEVVLFPNKESLDEFRTGKVAFTANASSVIVKAAASGTTNFGGFTAHAYSRGGMLLELSLGGQKFMFIPPSKPMEEIEKSAQQPSDEPEESEQQEQPEQHASDESEGSEQHASDDSEGSEQHASDESEDQEQRMSADPEESSHKEGNGEASDGHDGLHGLKKLGAKVVGKMREVGGHLPGLKKEAEISKRLHAESKAAVERMKAKDESLVKQVDEAYAYAIFPAVGRASLVLGGSYGKGEVFRDGKLEGYAGLVQLTLGLQVGGQTYSELVLFQDEEALKRLKAGKIGFAGNLSAVIVKGGAAATNNYKHGMQIYVHSEGGLLGEAAIGAQKLIYRPSVLMRKSH